MKKYLAFICITFIFTSCGPSLCDCAFYRTDNEKACKALYKSRLGTENPSPIRLESIRKNCKD